MPLLSIVVPVCNVERYLNQCMDSILAQTFRDFEVICVNDGSRDSCGDILDEYAARDSRVRVIHKPNSGYGHSMNLGISRACGKFLGIIESDDFIAPNMYEVLLRAVEELKVPIVKCGFYEYWNDDCMQEAGPRAMMNVSSAKVISVVEDCAVFRIAQSIWAGVYDLAWLRESGIEFLETPGASYQDTSFHFKGFVVAERIGVVPEALLYYRQNNPGSSINSRNKAMCLYTETDEMWRWGRERMAGDPRFLAIFLRYCYEILTWNAARAAWKLKYPVLRRASREFRVWRSAGSFDASVFSADELGKLDDLTRSPMLYIIKRLMKKVFR